MEISEIKEVLKKNGVYKNYLIKDKDVIRNSFNRSRISFKEALVLGDIDSLDTGINGVEEDILKTLDIMMIRLSYTM